jgi:hypothetical protein
MLIRKDQLQVFEKSVRADLERRTLEHVSKFFPSEISVLGADAARKLVHDGIGRAQALQFLTEGNIYKFVDLLVVLDGDFDTRFEWARNILAEGDSSDADSKMRRLMSAADEQLRGKHHG